MWQGLWNIKLIKSSSVNIQGKPPELIFINVQKNVNIWGEIFLYVLTQFFVLLPIRIQSLHNRGAGIV